TVTPSDHSPLPLPVLSNSGREAEREVSLKYRAKRQLKKREHSHIRQTRTANAPVRQSRRATQCILDQPGTARRRPSGDTKNWSSARSEGSPTSDLQGPESGRIGMACISNATVAREVQELLLGCLRGVTFASATRCL